jgi:hypothetical protein
MSNYSKVTDFAAKDSLSTGNPAKIVKGTEIDDELTAISGAISSKADLASPTFTGTPAAPTADAGTSTTQLATTAFVQATLSALYPVGTIYSNISVSTNPATLFGFGTWVAITGRVVVGLDSGDTAFDTAGETGGSKDAIVVSHTHTATDAGHTHTYSGHVSSSHFAYDGGDGASGVGIPSTSGSTTASGTASISVSTTGSSATNANLQPYVVAYVWKRTA